jgi:hypothetical protein
MMVVGYSGRDASVMEALNSVLRETAPFPNGLYWVTSSAARLLPAVRQFLESAHLAGVDVAVVECKTFDELAADVIKQIDLPQVLVDQVMQGRVAPRLVPVKLPDAEARQFPVLRYSALLIESMPRVARRMVLSQATNSPDVRALQKEHRCRAIVAANGRELAVFGRDAEVLSALSTVGAKVAGTLELDPTKDSWALGLLYDALVKALSRHRPLIPRFKRYGHSLVVSAPREGDSEEWARTREQHLAQLRAAYESVLTGKVPKLDFRFHEGVFLKLEQIEGRWWCGFEPYTFVDIPRPERAEQLAQADPAKAEHDAFGVPVERRAGDPAGDWRRERWASKYNKHWASIIEAWAALLTFTEGDAVRAFGLEEGVGIDAVFGISRVTGWSRPGHHHTYFDRTR